MKRKYIATFLLTVFIWHISFGFSVGNMFNPFHWASKAFKVANTIAEEMWKFKPSDIGEAVDPFRWGRDAMTRGAVLGMKLRRAMMEEDFGLMDTMTLYGFKMYETGANMMPGDYEDEIMAEMIQVILSNDEITKEFIKEAIKYDGLSDLMLRIADRNPKILEKLLSMMSADNSVSELLLTLAIKNKKIGKFLFRKMNNTSFRVLIKSMSESKGVAKKATQLFDELAYYVFSENSNFQNYFFLPENSIYVEKMMYSVFKNKDAIDNFEQFFSKIPQEWQFKMMNYITSGITPDGGVYPDEPYYFMHAVIKGMAKGKTLKYLMSKDLSKYESMKFMVDKFMKTLITGAQLYKEEEHQKILSQMSKLGVASNNEEEQPEPDPSIPPPRIEFKNKDIEDYFKINKKDYNVSLSIDYDINFFGFDFKDKKLYSKGDNDKWLLLPYWLSPATWINISNKKEDREISNQTKIGEISFKKGKEFLVFIIASQFSPCVVWALEQGFVPIYGEFIESEKQTGFVLLGKVFDKDSLNSLEIYGNGGGFFSFVIGIMEENDHPMYLFAKNKILSSHIDYTIKANDIFNYAKFDEQSTFTIKPDDTKIKHKVYRTAIPMFNDTFFKTEEGFVMIDKRNGSIKIKDDENFQKENITFPPTEKQIFSLIHKEGTYVAVGEDKKVYISKNGKFWEEIKTGSIMYDVEYGNGKFVAAGEDGKIIIINPEAKTIQKIDRKYSGAKKDILDVAYLNGEFFFVGEDGLIVVSSTLEDKKEAWEQYKIDLQKILNAEKKIKFKINKIAHFDKYYVLTDNGFVLYSTDLTDWKVGIQLDTMAPLIDIDYLPERNIILAAGLNGVIVSSKDGINWDDAKLLDCESFVGVYPVNDTGFLLLARNGKIVKFLPYSEELEKQQNSQTDIEQNIEKVESVKSVSTSGGCSIGQKTDISPLLMVILSAMAFLLKNKRKLNLR